MSMRFILLLLNIALLTLLQGCYFQLAKNNIYALNLSKINPRTEQEHYDNLLFGANFVNDNHSKFSVSDLSYSSQFIADEDTGNQWRQYNITATWNLAANGKNYQLSANQFFNIASNQTPNDINIYSEIYKPLRQKLLYETYIKIKQLQFS